MEKTFIIILAVCLFIGCGSPKPFRSDDFIVILNLNREFVKENAERKPFFEEDRGTVWEETEKEEGYSGGFTLGPDGDYVILGILLLVVGVTSMKYLEGTHAYVYPEGWPGYKQEISWGKNRVFVPSALKGKYVRFVVEIKGNYKGQGTLTVYGSQGESK